MSSIPPFPARLRSLAAPPVFADEEKTRRAGILNTILLASIVLLGSEIVIGIVFSLDALNAYLVDNLACLIGLILLWFVVRRGYVTVTAFGLCSLCLLFIADGVRVSGVTDPIYYGSMVVVLVGAFVIGRRAAIFFTVFVIAIGVIGIDSKDDVAIWLALTMIFTVSAMLLVLADNGIRAALHRAHRDEAELRASEARYRQLMDVTPVAQIVYDLAEYRIRYANPAAVSMYGGHTEADLLGRRSLGFIAPDDRDAIRERQERLMQGEPVEAIEVTSMRIDGVTITTEASAIPIVYQGQPAVLAVVTDITERKAAEAERRRAEVLEIELERERRLAQMRDTFMGMMSHEFRTPLTVVQSSKELLERYQDRMTEEQRSTHFERMGQQIRVMLDLLEDILTLSKASAGVLEFLPTPTDLRALCDEIIAAQTLASGDRVPIRLNTSGDDGMFQGDSRLLRHAITNLLSNAIKYSPEGTGVQLGLDTSDPHRVVITVRDQGIGIPEADRAKLFDPFFRASNVGKIEGTGLGLAIVQHSVSMHGGTITCDGVPGGGTQFTMHLPLLRLDPVAT